MTAETWNSSTMPDAILSQQHVDSYENKNLESSYAENPNYVSINVLMQSALLMGQLEQMHPNALQWVNVRRLDSQQELQDQTHRDWVEKSLTNKKSGEFATRREALFEKRNRPPRFIVKFGRTELAYLHFGSLIFGAAAFAYLFHPGTVHAAVLDLSAYSTSVHVNISNINISALTIPVINPDKPADEHSTFVQMPTLPTFHAYIPGSFVITNSVEHGANGILNNQPVVNQFVFHIGETSNPTTSSTTNSQEAVSHSVFTPPIVTGINTVNAIENGPIISIDGLINASNTNSTLSLSLVDVPDIPTGFSYNAATHTFSIDPSNAAFHYLTPGQIAHYVYQYGVSNGVFTTPDTIIFNVTGVNITPTHVAPVVTAGDTLNYTESQTAVSDPNLSVSDVDSNYLTGATITISSGLISSDVLNFTNQNGITGSYNNGVLTLSGTESLANYQTALQSITFANNSQDPTVAGTDTSRTLSIQVNDGASSHNLSNVATDTINITAVDTAPVNTVPSNYTVTENDDLTLSGLSVSDVDSGNNAIQVTLSVANGTLDISDSVNGGLTSSQITGNGTDSVILTGSQTAIDATLANTNGVTYEPTSNFYGVDTLTLSTNDLGNTGTGGPLTTTSTIPIKVIESTTDDNGTDNGNDHNVFVFTLGNHHIIFAINGDQTLTGDSSDDIMIGGFGTGAFTAGATNTETFIPKSGTNIIFAGFGDHKQYDINYQTDGAATDYIHGMSTTSDSASKSWINVIDIAEVGTPLSSLTAFNNDANVAGSWIMEDNHHNVIAPSTSDVTHQSHTLGINQSGVIYIHVTATTTETVTFDNIEKIQWHNP